MKSYCFIALACMAVLVAAAVSESAYETTQIADNAGTDRDPQIDGTQVVWSGNSTGNFEIYLYDVIGADTTKLSKNSWDDVSPSIHDGLVAWQGDDGDDNEIFLFDSGGRTQLTDNLTEDLSPRTHEGQVVWQGVDGDDFDIFVFDGIEVRQITDNDLEDRNPEIRSGEIVWEQCDGDCDEGEGDWEIFHHDLVTSITTQITTNDWNDEFPDVDGGIVTYQRLDGPGDFDIYLWDGSETVAVTDNEVIAKQPKIDGDLIVWSQNVAGTQHDIYAYEISTGESFLVATDGAHNLQQQVDLGLIAWLSRGEEEQGVYLDQVGELSQGSTANEKPQISDQRVVWFGYDGTDMEIYLSQPGGPLGDVAPRGDVDELLNSSDQGVSIEMIRGSVPPARWELEALDVAPFEACEGGGDMITIRPVPDGRLTVEDMATLIQIHQGYVVTVTVCP